MKVQQILAGAAALMALVVAGCGGGSATSGGSGYSGQAGGGGAGKGAPLNIVSNPRLGKILTDGSGRTLYDFPIDKGTTSVCYGACASLWPPYTTAAKPVAGQGVSQALIGTSKRKDGSTEVTYAGHPLYYYAPDRKQGQITGQALNQFGAPWYVLTPSGREIHKRPQ